MNVFGIIATDFRLNDKILAQVNKLTGWGVYSFLSLDYYAPKISITHRARIVENKLRSALIKHQNVLIPDVQSRWEADRIREFGVVIHDTSAKIRIEKGDLVVHTIEHFLQFVRGGGKL